MEKTYFDKAAEWFTKAGDYEDAPTLTIYCKARVLAANDLAQAEDLLVQLPRDYRDVDVMLTAIESYRSWPGTYTLTESSGNTPLSFTHATLTLVYEQRWIEESPTLEWEVALYLAGKAIGYDSGGAMPAMGVLSFTDGSESDWCEFTVTEKQIQVLDVEIDSKYGWRTERKYVFDRSED